MKREDIVRAIEDFMKKGEGNTIAECGGIRIYDSPLVGFASAHDPLYSELKEQGIIGPHNMMPQDWVEDAKSVIVFFLPFTKEAVKRNYAEGMSSKEWYLSRYYGEDVLNALRDHWRQPSGIQDMLRLRPRV